jgi:hypothetical protein
MARNRQRAKQRQAERRAKRLSEQGDGPTRPRGTGIPGVDAPPAEPVDVPEERLLDDPTTVDPSPAVPP